MPNTDTSRRLRPDYLDQDVESLRGMRTIAGYTSGRPETTPEALQPTFRPLKCHTQVLALKASENRELKD